MIFTKLPLLFLLTFLTPLFARELKKEYFTPTNEIHLLVITKDAKNDAVIGTIEKNRYLKRIRSKDILRILREHGYHDFKARHSYVTFLKTSPLNLLPLKEKLKHHYEENYKAITIEEVHIIPKNHIERLPKNYTFKIQKNTHLKSNGTFSIITPKKKQFFFTFYIDATLPVYFTKRKIARGEVLSQRNLQKKTLRLERFRAQPLQELNTLQAKHHLNAKKLVTLRDVEKLDLVRRGEFVSVILKEGGFEIDMDAKALQAGGLNDIILIQNKHGKKLRAKVVGKNLVEIQAPK